jgi:hypothetical protein
MGRSVLLPSTVTNDTRGLDGGAESDGRLDALSPEAAGLLAHPRRRHAIEHLRTLDGPIGLSDLAEEVAVAERGTVSRIPPEDVEPVHVSLHHSHVPKLVEAGVVEYSRKSDLVELTDGATRVAPYVAGGE